MKDTWYGRLAWFLFFSFLFLGIFYLFDIGLHQLLKALNDNEYVASFVDEEYQYSLSDNNLVVLKITSDAKDYYYDIWFDDYDLGIKVTDKDVVEIDLSLYDLELTIGEHTIKSSFFGRNGIAKYRESLITTKLIITE